MKLQRELKNVVRKQNLYRFDEFTLDTLEKQLIRNDEVISLQPRAFNTLCLLVENQGKLLSKDFMIKQIWTDTIVEERNLAQHIHTLRKILNKNKEGKNFIETIPKQGYSFCCRSPSH